MGGTGSMTGLPARVDPAVFAAQSALAAAVAAAPSAVVACKPLITERIDQLVSTSCPALVTPSAFTFEGTADGTACKPLGVARAD